MTEAEKRIVRARAGLLNRDPFFGMISTRLELVEAPDKTTTAGTDGEHLIYNPDFILELKPADVEFVVRHEVLHVALEHVFRREGRDPLLWNMAADYAVNGILESGGDRCPEGMLYAAEWEGWPAERIYNELRQNAGRPRKPKSLGSGPTLGDDDVRDHVPAKGETKAEAVNDLRQAVQQAQAMARQAGTLPGGIARELATLEASRVDYKSILRQWLLQATRSDYSWSRPSRRALAMGYYAPSLRSEETGLVAYAVDVSGSMDQRILNAAWREARSAQEQIRGPALILFADASVQSYRDIEEGEELPPLGQTGGGGGTDFRPAFQFVKKRGAQPAALVYFTDLEGTFPTKDPGYPVLWVTDRIPDRRPPFGMVLPFLGE